MELVPVGLISKHLCKHTIRMYGMHAQNAHLMTLQGHLVHLALVYGQFLHFLWYKP